VAETVYVPPVATVVDGPTAPFDQVYLVALAAVAVSTVLLPLQNDARPVMVGVAGVHVDPPQALGAPQLHVPFVQLVPPVHGTAVP